MTNLDKARQIINKSEQRPSRPKKAKPKQAPSAMEGAPPKALGCKAKYGIDLNEEIIADKMEKYPNFRGMVLKKVQALKMYWSKVDREQADYLYEFAKGYVGR